MASAIKAQIQERLKAAMKAGDKQTVQHARSVTAEIKQVEVDSRKDLTDEDVIDILARLVKQRNESIAAAEQAGRAEMAEAEKAEKAFLETFLPAPLTDDEVRALVRDAIKDSGASSPKDMGQVMKLVTPHTKGRADGKTVSTIVRDELQAAAS